MTLLEKIHAYCEIFIEYSDDDEDRLNDVATFVHNNNNARKI